MTVFDGRPEAAIRLPMGSDEQHPARRGALRATVRSAAGTTMFLRGALSQTAPVVGCDPCHHVCRRARRRPAFDPRREASNHECHALAR
jgi:hypothetical protein